MPSKAFQPKTFFSKRFLKKITVFARTIENLAYSSLSNFPAVEKGAKTHLLPSRFLTFKRKECKASPDWLAEIERTNQNWKEETFICRSF